MTDWLVSGSSWKGGTFNEIQPPSICNIKLRSVSPTTLVKELTWFGQHHLITKCVPQSKLSIHFQRNCGDSFLAMSARQQDQHQKTMLTALRRSALCFKLEHTSKKLLDDGHEVNIECQSGELRQVGEAS